MCILMKDYLVLIVIWLLSNSIAAVCPKDYKPIDWNLRGNKSTIPANNFQLSLNNSSVFKSPKLKIHAENFKEDFTFILFALPLDKNHTSCPSEIRKIKDLRRHICVIHIPESAPSCDVSFDAIITGCFYVVIINEEGTYWQLDPVFYQTNFTHVDTKPKLIGNIDIRPERRESSREILPVIKVPLQCIQVIATLYEFEGNFKNATDYENNPILPEGRKNQQSCTIFYDRNHTTVELGCTEKNTNLIIDADLFDQENDTWTAKITWKNLRRGDNYTCYMTFNPIFVNNCLNSYSWLPIDPIIFYGGKCDQSNNPNEMNRGIDISLIIGISCSLVGMLVIAILAYLRFKYSRSTMNKEYGEGENSGIQETFLLNSDEGELSDEILILYVRDHRLVMKAIIDELKNDLTRECLCHIKDVYDLNEWAHITRLGATEWIEQQFKAGSRVVWIDTPKFRSSLNDKEKMYAGDDFRDEVLPHAVNLVKVLFQDATTQYLRHFVVQIKGVEFDDRQADPLQTLTPHVRYCIPDQLSDLIKHLNNCPQKPLEN